MRLRPLLDWIVVQLDPIPTHEGSILLVHGARVRTARVRAVGPGRKLSNGQTAPPDVHPGDKVAFFREHLEHQQGKTLMHTLEDLGENIGLIREPDVLFVIPEGVDVKVSV